MNRNYVFVSALLTAAMLMTACGDVSVSISEPDGAVEKLVGSGNPGTESREVSEFDRIALFSAGTVFVTQGDEESLTVETDDNLLRYVDAKVAGGTLRLSETAEVSNTALEPSNGIVFRVVVVDLAAVELNGAGSFEVDGLTSDRFDVLLRGAGDIWIDSLVATSVDVTMSGAGSVRLSGVVQTEHVRMPGVADYDASDLRAKTASLELAGAGYVAVWATDRLDVTLNGEAEVDYYGSPEVSQVVNGPGRVTNRGDK